MDKGIGLIEYFATGEGLSIIIESGTKVEIENNNNYYKDILEFYTIEEIQKIIKLQKEAENNSEIKETYKKEFAFLCKIKNNTPMFLKQIEKNAVTNLKYRMHFNYS